MNEETIWRSACIYASNKPLASFVIPRIEGKAAGTWQPSAGSPTELFKLLQQRLISERFGNCIRNCLIVEYSGIASATANLNMALSA